MGMGSDRWAKQGKNGAAAACLLGITRHVSRRHYAKWSAARQEGISTIMRLVHDGELIQAGTPQIREQDPPLIE